MDEKWFLCLWKCRILMIFLKGIWSKNHKWCEKIYFSIDGSCFLFVLYSLLYTNVWIFIFCVRSPTPPHPKSNGPYLKVSCGSLFLILFLLFKTCYYFLKYNKSKLNAYFWNSPYLISQCKQKKDKPSCNKEYPK